MSLDNKSLNNSELTIIELKIERDRDRENKNDRDIVFTFETDSRTNSALAGVAQCIACWPAN